MPPDFHYQSSLPPPALADVVESFWRLENRSGDAKDLVVLPDGRVDIFFSYAAAEPYHVTLLGLGSGADQVTFAPGAVICAVSLRPLAVEYVLRTSVADILGAARPLPPDFWGISPADLTTLTAFQQQAVRRLTALFTSKVDERKQRLFELLDATHGTLSVQELADRAAWSSRQINRYFQAKFGLSLKAYGAILRFRASLAHLRAGRLFPEMPYADQPHFIREVRRLAGVKPTELAQNQNDRFIQLLAWPEE